MPPLDDSRYSRLDALRGAAIVWMAVFHFCFDLGHFGWLREDFYGDPFWTSQRLVIVSLFVLIAGMGQAVAWQRGQNWARFWRRWGQVVACALLVSLGSWWMFPRSFISFGVLHGLAGMMLIVRLTASHHRWYAPAGALAIAMPAILQHPFFDSRWTNWLGLVTHKPITEDYVPLLPWLGVMLWGFALGQTLLGRWPRSLAGPLVAPLRPLATLGRWSLSFYMLHQPVLIGLIAAASALLRGE